MKLILTNGYPFPYPANLTEAESDAINAAAAETTLEIHNVWVFERKHTVTVEFETYQAYLDAIDKTGWTNWSHTVAEAKTSQDDGYEHPAIIAGNTAYCGFQLVNEP